MTDSGQVKRREATEDEILADMNARVEPIGVLKIASDGVSVVPTYLGGVVCRIGDKYWLEAKARVEAAFEHQATVV